LVIDPLAKPPIASGALQPWGSLIGGFAELGHVASKISGLVTEADWTSWKTADLRPYVDHAIEVFGPERLVFGSDWPVCLLAATYAGVAETTRALLGGLTEDERTAVMSANAIRIYGL
jgi:L-fuconolactonase